MHVCVCVAQTLLPPYSSDCSGFSCAVVVSFDDGILKCLSIPLRGYSLTTPHVVVLLFQYCSLWVVSQSASQSSRLVAMLFKYLGCVKLFFLLFLRFFCCHSSDFFQFQCRDFKTKLNTVSVGVRISYVCECYTMCTHMLLCERIFSLDFYFVFFFFSKDIITIKK